MKYISKYPKKKKHFKKGIITAKYINSNTRTSSSIWTVVHSYLQLSCAISSLFGFFVIFITKIRDEDDHFRSWHSYFGAGVLLTNFLQTYIGIRLHNPISNSSHFFPVNLGDDKLLDLDPNTLKLYHKNATIITYFLSLITICLGIWNVSKFQEEIGQVILFVMFGLLLGVGVRVVTLQPRKAMIWRVDEDVAGFKRGIGGMLGGIGAGIGGRDQLG